MLSDLYRVIPLLRAWWPDGSAPRLLRCRHIKGPRGRHSRQRVGLIQAVLEYDDGCRIFYCPVGATVTVPEMLKKWEVRTRGLWTYSLDEHLDRGRDHRYEQIDPDFDWMPWPSGVLVVAADWWVYRCADRNLPREGYRGDAVPFALANAQTLEVYFEDVLRPRPEEYLADWPFRRSRFPRRPKVVRPDAPATAEDLTGSTVHARIVDLAAEWSGLRRKDLARRLKRGRRTIIDPAVDELLGAGWLREVSGMLYLGGTGILYVARRDRTSPHMVRTRVEADIRWDHQRVAPRRLHTIAVNRVMIWLHENNIQAYAGWRAVRNLEGTQLAPDLVILAWTLLGRGTHEIEVERTAVHPEQVAG